jgi:serine/threonine protein kinase
LYWNIKSGPLKLPVFLSAEARDLIKKLLERNPHQRLGAGEGGAAQIKAHPFFKSVNWNDVLNKKIFPPERPEKRIRRRAVPNGIFTDPEVSEAYKAHYRVAAWSFAKHQNK